MVAEVERYFRRANYRTRVAMAGNIAAAPALVRARHNGFVVAEGDDVTALSSLAVAAL